MEFLLLIWASPTAQVEDVQAYVDLDAALEASGELVRSAPFQGPDRTAHVRVREGGASLHRGPAQATEAWLAGYYLVDCATPERAQEIAARIPDARTGTVEIKPVLDLRAEHIRFEGGSEWQGTPPTRTTSQEDR